MKKVALLILAAAGLAFIIISAPDVIKTYKIKNDGVQAEGTVTNLIRRSGKSELSDVTVVFSLPEGTPVIASAPKRNYVQTGEKTKLWYDRNDPHIITFGDSAGYNLRAVILGGFIFIFGMYLFSRSVFSDLSGKKLLKTGIKIPAEIHIERDERFRAGDRNPWIIKGTWNDITSGTEHIFRSKPYTINPEPYLKGRSHIDVYIKSGDPKKYYMDLSFMPEGNYTIG